MVLSRGKVQGQILIWLCFRLYICIHLSGELLWIFTVIHEVKLQWICLLILYELMNTLLNVSYICKYCRLLSGPTCLAILILFCIKLNSYDYIPTQDPLQIYLFTFSLSLIDWVVTKVYNISSSGCLKGLWELWCMKHSEKEKKKLLD